MIRFFFRITVISALIRPGLGTDGSGASRNETVIREEIKSLMNTGHNLVESREIARIDSAITVYEKIVELARDNFGESDTAAASAYSRLGICHYWKMNYAKSDSLQRAAIDIWERNFGVDCPESAICHRMLGDSNAARGFWSDAEIEYKKATEILRISEKRDLNQLAIVENNLALLYKEQGRFDEAIPLFESAADFWTEAFGPKTYWLGFAEMNLGNLYLSKLDYENAEAHLTNSLGIIEGHYGPDHLYVASCVSMIALILQHQEKYTEAESLFSRALRIKENSLGADHPLTANTMSQLARSLMQNGSILRARSYLERAHRIYTGIYGESTPLVDITLPYLASIEHNLGNDEVCLKYLNELQKFRHSFLEGAFTYASERQKLRYVKSFPPIDSRSLSFAIETKSEPAIRSAFDMVIRGKAMVADAVAMEKERSYCSYDESLAEAYKRLSGVCDEIASLAVSGTIDLSAGAGFDKLSRLTRLKDSLETELSHSCREFASDRNKDRFEIDDLKTRIPASSVLLEFVRYSRFDFERFVFASPKYALFTFNSTGKIRIFDLGAASTIDSLIGEFTYLINKAPEMIYSGHEAEAETDLAENNKRLYDLVLGVAKSCLDTVEEIIICADGDLNLLPFDILPDPDGKYLIEKYRIRYLSTGRDLLDIDTPSDSNRQLALVLANPDNSGRHQNREYELSCVDYIINPLPATVLEGEAVENILKKNTELTTDFRSGGTASERALRDDADRIRILHLATHGFYCDSVDPISTDESYENPLLKSGLILAATERTDNSFSDSFSITDAADDGILTSLEVSGLNLTGAEMVVLSACRTGLGDVVSGEGVFGLRRAFQLAGVKSVVMSMWSVPDKQTKELMTGFYGNWLSGNSKSSAMRRAALDILTKRRESHGAAHPLFWGGFVLVGLTE